MLRRTVALFGLSLASLVAGCEALPDVSFYEGGVDEAALASEPDGGDTGSPSSTAGDAEPDVTKPEDAARPSSADAAKSSPTDAGEKDAGDPLACLPSGAPAGAACCSPDLPCVGQGCDDCAQCSAMGCHSNQYCCVAMGPPGPMPPPGLQCSPNGKNCE